MCRGVLSAPGKPITELGPVLPCCASLLPQHLGDFPHRLSQHCHAVYEYTPPPPMSWPELADEIWCHRYYLANLCDEDRFRAWPVVEHIPLLQVTLRGWAWVH